MVREKKIVQQQKRPHWRSEKKAKIFFAVYRWKEPVHLVEKPTEGQYKMFTTPYLTCGWLHDSFASTIAALISFDLFFKCLLRCSSASHSCIPSPSSSIFWHTTVCLCCSDATKGPVCKIANSCYKIVLLFQNSLVQSVHYCSHLMINKTENRIY